MTGSSASTAIRDTTAATGTNPKAGLCILIADKFEQTGIDSLEALGCTVQAQPGLTADDLAGAVADCDPDVIVVRSTKVQGPVFDAAKKLSLVIRAGAGYDTIDVKAASARGVFDYMTND